jgi:hypothetical protein
MIVNRIYGHQNLVAVACFLPGRAKDLSASLYYCDTRFGIGLSSKDRGKTARWDIKRKRTLKTAIVWF